MEPIALGVAAAGIAMAVIYKTASGRNRPTKTARGPKRTGGASGKPPKRSWLVQAYNSSGAPEVKSGDLSGASAEITGRAVGAVGRGTRRRWSILKSAAERSHDQRQKRWQQAGGPTPAGFRRLPKPQVKTVKPTTATSPSRPSGAATPAKPKTAAKQSPGPAPPATRHLAPVPNPTPTPGATVTATTDTPAAPAAPEAPPDWTLMIDRVANFVPEDDAALIAFMHGEAAAVVRYAEALEQARENCTNDVGLDPAAVEGFVTYSEHMSEASERMAEAYRTFVAVYGEIMKLADDGVTMPYNGRFWTGAAG